MRTGIWLEQRACRQPSHLAAGMGVADGMQSLHHRLGDLRHAAAAALQQPDQGQQPTSCSNLLPRRWTDPRQTFQQQSSGVDEHMGTVDQAEHLIRVRQWLLPVHP